MRLRKDETLCHQYSLNQKSCLSCAENIESDIILNDFVKSVKFFDKMRRGVSNIYIETKITTIVNLYLFLIYFTTLNQ